MNWKAGDDYKALPESGPDRMVYYRPMEPFVVKFIQRASDEMFACHATNVSHDEFIERMDAIVREAVNEAGLDNLIRMLNALFRWKQLTASLMDNTTDASQDFLETYGIDLSAYVSGD